MKKLLLALISVLAIGVPIAARVISSRPRQRGPVLLTDSQMRQSYGGVITYCGGPTCPNSGSCVYSGTTGIWILFYNNGYLDCYTGPGSCADKTGVGGVLLTVPCYAKEEGNSTCTDPISDQYVSSNQPYCGQ